MSAREGCPHYWGVNDWTWEPETGLWVHADPSCRRPSPLVLAAAQEDRVTSPVRRVKQVTRRFTRSA